MHARRNMINTILNGQSFSLNPMTSLHGAFWETPIQPPPSFFIVLLAVPLQQYVQCNVPAVCDTRYREHRCRESNKRYVWDVINRSSSTSLAVPNSMHVKRCKYREAVQPQPRKTLKPLCLAMSPGQQIYPEFLSLKYFICQPCTLCFIVLHNPISF